MHLLSLIISWFSKSITAFIFILHKYKFAIIPSYNKLLTFTFQTSGLQILLGVHLYQFYRIVKYYYVLTNFTLFFNFTYHTIFLFSHCLQGIRFDVLCTCCCTTTLLQVRIWTCTKTRLGNILFSNYENQPLFQHYTTMHMMYILNSCFC